MQRSGSCLDLSDLAAFAEGRLQGAEREQVIAHLNRCGYCYEIVSDTMHFLQQGEEEDAETISGQSLKRWWPIALAAALLLALVMFRPVLQLFQPSPWDQESEWADMGLLPADAPRSVRAKAVFERVARTFEFPEGMTPRPLLISKSSSPEAMALTEGKIVITSGGLDACYRDVPPDVGDALLAYVLGHELDHLRNKEDFHAFAAYSLKDVQPGVHPELAGVERNAEKELRADETGLVHAVLAGYDPRLILGQGEGFFQPWVSQPTYPSHPEPQQRAQQLLKALDEIRAHLQEFQIGVRYYQLARYDLSTGLLERFKSRFPSREVYSNLGLAYFQKAALDLARCDGSLLFDFFRFPLQIDTETLADVKTYRGINRDSHCFEEPGFNNPLESSLENFRKARSIDPSYLPALLNLISANLLARNSLDAFLEADAAPRTALDDYRFQWVNALSDFAVGQDRNQADAVQEAIEAMRRLHDQHPRFPEIAYDLAIMLDDDQQYDQAAKVWEAFVALEPYGPYAEHARGRLGMPVPDRPATPAPPPPPLPLGPPSADTQGRLQLMRRFDLDAGDGIPISVYEDDRLRAIARNGSLEVVEQRLDSPLSEQDARARFGEPQRRVRSLQGEFWDYSGFAVDLHGQSVSILIHYSFNGNRH